MADQYEARRPFSGHNYMREWLYAMQGDDPQAPPGKGIALEDMQALIPVISAAGLASPELAQDWGSYQFGENWPKPPKETDSVSIADNIINSEPVRFADQNQQRLYDLLRSFAMSGG